MTNLKLAADAPTPLEKRLLEASRAEQPSDEHKARLRAALGLGIPLGAPPPAPPAPFAEPAQGAKALSVAKAASVGFVACAVAFAVVLARRPESSVVPPARVVAKVQLASSQASPPVAPPTAPAASAQAPEPPPPLRTARAAATASADLSEQIRLIEAARRGLSARDATSALAALDSYASRFPRGAFGQEALVLRIRALDQAGDFARATTLAKSFVARFPQSPHLARLKPIAERGASR